MFKETHPILGTRDIKRAIEFYTRQLGFTLAFADKADAPNYVGFRRDAVELHVQVQYEHEMGTIRLRFLVETPDALFNEYRQRGVECAGNGAYDTPWGTREFAHYDLDRKRSYLLQGSDRSGEGTLRGRNWRSLLARCAAVVPSNYGCLSCLFVPHVLPTRSLPCIGAGT